MFTTTQMANHGIDKFLEGCAAKEKDMGITALDLIRVKHLVGVLMTVRHRLPSPVDTMIEELDNLLKKAPSI